MLEQMTKEQIINQIKQIAERFDNISKVWLFGSVARSEHNAHSDVDLVIEIIDHDAYLETWDEFRISMIEEFDLLKSKNRSALLVNENLQITEDEIAEVQSQLAESEEIDLSVNKTAKIILHLIHDKHDTLVTSRYAHCVELE